MMRNAVIALSVLILVAISTFFILFETYSRDVDIGWNKDAQKNPFLAAKLYLEDLGFLVDGYTSLDSVDLSNNELGTLIIANSSSVLSFETSDAIINWVSNGGHLIVGASGIDKGEKILSKLGVIYEKNDTDSSENNDEEVIEEHKSDKLINHDHDHDHDQESDSDHSQKQKKQKLSDLLIDSNKKLLEEKQLSIHELTKIKEAEVEASDLSHLTFRHVERELVIHFSKTSIYHNYFVYLDEQHELNQNDEKESTVQEPYEGLQPLYWKGSDHGIHFMQLEIGDGLVTVVSDSGIWTTKNIQFFDHAELLHLLIFGDSIAIVFDISVPSLFSNLLEFFPEALLLLILTVLIWIHSRSQRVGPIVNEGDYSRRSLMDHINATSLWLWNGGWASDLIGSIRREINRKAMTVFPDYRTLNKKRRYQRIAEHCMMDVGVVTSVMEGAVNDDEVVFTHIIIELQKIKMKL